MGTALAAKPQEKKSKAAVPEPAPAEPPQLEQIGGLPAGMPLFLQRSAGGGCSCGASGGEEEECPACRQQRLTLHRKSDGGSRPGSLPATIPVSVHRVLRGAGAPIERSSARFMEARFSRDFGHVRIHDGAEAARAAASVNARAFTAGRNIVFGAGQYAPQSDNGRRLLAHELTHVVQQSGSGSTAPPAGGIQAKLRISSPCDPDEREADRVASEIMQPEGRAEGVQVSAMPQVAGRIARQDDPDAGPPPADAGDAGPTPDAPGGERYSKQAACVARLGGCTSTRDAGTVEDSDITDYNKECRDKDQTGYAGPDIRPSDDECNQYTSGALIDPAKLQRLQGLAIQYLVRLSQGQLRLADVQRIDAALRRANAAIQRGGGHVPGLPDQPAVPEGASPDAPVLIAGLPALAVAPEVAAPAAAAGPTLTLIQGGAATAATTGTEVAATGAAVGAGVTVGTVVAGVFLAVAAIALVGFIIYLATREDNPVDPTIPKDLDESSNTIEQILANARPPNPFFGPAPTPVPVPGPRRWPNQTCENNVLDALEDWMHQHCDQIPGESCSPSKVSQKRLDRRPCSEIRTRIQALEECIRRRQHIQDSCFGGQPDPRHQKPLDDLNSGLAACRALELINCAPGHPMADL